MKFLKASLSMACLTFILSTNFAHAGVKEAGGGDLCEDQIKIIRDDIASWIQKGGPKDLKLPAEVSVSNYSENMLTQISKAKIRCVGKGDREYPVRVHGTPKICRFDVGFLKNTITCDRSAFLSLSETQQYILTHHEYAGLAGIEKPKGDDSNYAISNQLTSYLEDKVVKKLAVKSASKPAAPSGWRQLEGPQGGEVAKAFGEALRRTNFVDCDVEVFLPHQYTCNGNEYSSVTASFRPPPKNVQFGEKPEMLGLKSGNIGGANNIMVNQGVCDGRERREERMDRYDLYVGRDSTTGSEVIMNKLRKGFTVEELNGDPVRIDLDSFFYLDSTSTTVKKAVFRIGKEEKVNKGTITNPRWVQEFRSLWSFTCNAKLTF